MPQAKGDAPQESLTPIFVVRTRIEYERLSEHSTHNDRVTNIGWLLSCGASPLPAANSYLDLAAVVASEEASVVEASLEAAVVSVDVSVAVESALFKDTCAQSFWSTSLS